MKVALGRRDSVGPGLPLLAALVALVAAMAALLLAYNSSPARAADGSCSTTAGITTCPFAYTGSEQTFVVPPTVSSVHVIATGAPGAVGVRGSTAGRGARVSGDLTVAPGQTLYVNVGGAPTGSGTSNCNRPVDCIGGFNGGVGSTRDNDLGGGGGGASDVRTVARDQSGSLASRLIVAGGGGGSGGGNSPTQGCFFALGGRGGDAGKDGGAGDTCATLSGGTGGQAGTQSAGGAGGSPGGQDGSEGLGGLGDLDGGGGGGGLFGGGGGGSLTSMSVSGGGVPIIAPAGGGGGGSNLVPTGGNATIATAVGSSVTISYTEPNTAPTAADDSSSTAEDTLLTANVLVNDTDPDGNPLTAVQESAPSHGTLTLNSNGSFTYKPNANYNGPDSFTYKANDGTVDSNTATVNITVSEVDDNPVALNDTKTVAEDDAATAINVLFNDTDVDSGTKSIESVTQPAHGAVAITNNGADLTYKPNADYCNGGSPTDDFTYTLNGGSTANVAMTVTCVNDAPVAEDQSVTTDEDTPKDVTLSASDVESNPLTYEVVAEPSHGTLSGTGATRTYTPDADYNGTDSFTYKAKDASLESNSATVSITVAAVNDAPVAKDDSVTTNEDTAANGNVLTNDTDVDSANLTATKVAGPTHGTITFNAEGSFTYKPNIDYNGADSFTYRVCDNGLPGQCDTASVFIDVIPVDEPEPPAPKPACSDGKDNDGDGKTDLRDPGCTGSNDTSEFNRAPDPTPDCTIKGTRGEDVLLGTSNRDIICGYGGNDVIRGMGGNDLITGGAGSDAIQGNAGDDTIYGGDGRDTIQGNAGNDTIYGGSNNDTMQGNDGRDKLYGGSGDDTMQGGAGDDLLKGGTGQDTTQQ